MRLLLVEDDGMIGASVRDGLAAEGYAVDWVQDGAAASVAAALHPYDVIVLDLRLPRKDGLEVLRELRAKGRDTPVLIVTARDAVAERVAGLDAGADDYLVKPFDLDELAARLRALLRRRAGRAAPEIRHGPLTLDPATHAVSFEGRPVVLSAREFALLRALADAPGTVLSTAQLKEKVYGWDQDVESNTIEVYIHALRRKLAPDFIRNVRGVGYMVPRQWP